MYSQIGKMDTTKIYFRKQSIYFDAISTRISVSFVCKEKNRICMESQMISNGQNKRTKLQTSQHCIQNKLQIYSYSCHRTGLKTALANPKQNKIKPDIYNHLVFASILKKNTMEKGLFNNGVMKTENLQNRKGEWAFITALYNNQFRID